MKNLLSNIKIIALLLCVFACSAVKYNPTYITPSSKYHIVKKGETLYSISKQHNINAKKLSKYNQIKNNKIFIGQKLYFTPQTAVKQEYVSVRSIPKSGYHIVKKKETLYRLSKMYSIELIDLLDFNKLNSFDIKIGQKIYLTSKNIKQNEKNNETNIYQPKPNENIKKPDYNNLPKYEYHTVKNNEELKNIAKKYSISISKLKSINNLSSNKIKKNQKLKVKQIQKFTVHKVKRGEYLSKIAKKYKMSISQLKKLNNLKKSTVYRGQKLKVYALNSFGKSSYKPTSYSYNKNAINPLKNGKISSLFGMRNGRLHKGIDICASPGQPIHAALNGKAVFVGQQRGYGNVIILEHKNSIMTVYAHNESNLIRLGDLVKKGQPIATVGSTGNSSGPHLHFEYRIQGKAVNPQKIIRFDNEKI